MITITTIIILVFLVHEALAAGKVPSRGELCSQLEALWKSKKVTADLLPGLYCYNNCDFTIKDKDFDCANVMTYDVCDDLKKSYAKRGWMQEKEKFQYCSDNCTFSDNIKCFSYVDKKFSARSKVLTDLEDLVESIMTGSTKINDLEINIDEETKEVWFDLLCWVAPALLSLIPPILNQYKLRHLLWSVLFILINIALGFVAVPWSITFHNVLVCTLAHIYGSNSGQLAESLLPLASMVIVFLGVFVTEPIVQVGILFTVVAGCLGLLYYSFFMKRGLQNTQVMVVIFQLWIMVDLLHYTIELYSFDTLGGATFAMVLNCIIPNKSNTYWLSNAVSYSRTITGHLSYLKLYKVLIFVSSMLFQFFLTLLFRACLGAYCLLSLRYRFDGTSIGFGLVAYFCDLLGPVSTLWRLFIRDEHWNTRRLFYGLSGLAMLIMEFKHCREVFILRFIASFIDKVFVGSSYQKSMKYLGCNVEMQIAFPQRDALPWINIELLQSIADTTRALFVTRDSGKMVRGVACALSVNGRNMLYTVKHVIKDSQSVQFGEHIFNKKFTPLTSGDDPVVYIRQDSVEGPDVPIITPDEVNRIVSVACINVHKDGKGDDATYSSFVCLSSHFRVKDKELFASISLKKGDSGGPVFAVLDDGEIRFAGTVSAGRHDQGGGNIFSFACSTKLADLESSDDEEPDKLITASHFNERRSHNASFGFQDSAEYKAKQEVMSYIRGRQFKDLSDACNSFGVLDFDSTDKEATDEIIDIHDDTGYNAALSKLKTVLEEEREKWKDGFEGNDTNHRNSNKKRTKNWKKDRSYKKRLYITEAKCFIAKLLGSYERHDAKTIYYQSLRGGVPSCSPNSIITGFNGGWHFTN